MVNSVFGKIRSVYNSQEIWLLAGDEGVKPGISPLRVLGGKIIKRKLQNINTRS
jgi:hypothetical protein